MTKKKNSERWAKQAVQILTDDYTGADLPSNQAEKDYNGYITAKGMADKQTPNELPLYIPEDSVPDFVRPESPNSLVLLAEALDLIWDEADIYWDDNPYDY